MWTAAEVVAIAREEGFELAGIAAARPSSDRQRYQQWVDDGCAGRMAYLTDHRAAKRHDPRSLLPSARSILCVGQLYQTPHPHTHEAAGEGRAWISRYAWGHDYHDTLRAGLERVLARLRPRGEFDAKICVDTAPLLERSYARDAGLGWIGKNTCLINEPMGSWFFLGEMLLSLELEPNATPPPDRCGTCTRCIDACPTRAIVPDDGRFRLDARLCLSYLTIEHKGSLPEEHRPALGPHVFGCDICQDVCPWNARAPVTEHPSFQPNEVAPPLEKLAYLDPAEFRLSWGTSPVARAKHQGFLRNVATAMGNSGDPRLREPLTHLAQSPDPVVAEHAHWALSQLDRRGP
jgi:epoxyqueuosine reductase